MKFLRKSLKTVFVAVTAFWGMALLLSYGAVFVSPVEMPPLAFFGLGYPVILAINLLILAFWMIKRSRWVFLTAFILLIGLPIHTQFFQLNPGEKAIPGDLTAIRIMSYNVELFGWYHWRTNIQRRNKVFDQLAANPADIYCFQEFFYTNIRNRFDTRDTLLNLLETPHFHDHYTHEMHEVQFYGIATLSRFPIVNRGVIEFPNDKNNICIFSDLQIDDEIVRVYNGHLCSIRFSGDEHNYVGKLQDDPGLLEQTRVVRMYRRLESAFVKRAWQAELIRSHMEKCPYPIIFCGDFNDTPISYAYGVFDGFLKDLFRSRANGIGNTYVGNFPSFRIDYIFTSPEFYHHRFQVLPEELSDHKAVYGEVAY